MLAAVLLIGITVAMGGVLAYVFMGQMDTLTQSDSVTPSNVSIVDVGSSSYISANVKNTGNGEITDLEIIVEVDTDSGTGGVQPFEANFNPTTLQPGQTSTVNAEIVDTGSSPISMSAGQEYLVTVNGTTADGGNISYPSATRVR